MTNDDRVFFELAPMGKAPWVTLAALLLAAPLVLVAIDQFAPDESVAPGALALTVLITVAIFVALALVMRRRSVLLEHGQLVVRAAFYTRRVALAAIDLEQARAVDLREHKQFRPCLKTNGFALPGFWAGHFRDREKHRLFVLSTSQKVLILPLEDGSRLLLGPARPLAMLKALQDRARSSKNTTSGGAG